MSRRPLSIGRALRRASERLAQRRAQGRRRVYHAIIDGRELSDAESDHVLRVLVFAGDVSDREELRS